MLCPFCKKETKFLYTISRFEPPLTIFQCPECKLQMQHQTNPHQYYTKDYFNGTSPYSYFDERKYFQYCEYVWKARLKTIKRYKPPPARLLDVGCSFGGFLLTALKEGYEAFGIDISPYVVEEVKNHPILQQRISLSNVLDYTPPQTFDIITLIEVIEHLPEPEKVFQKLYDLLNSGGLLIIQTANFDGLQAKLFKEHYHYYLPGHLYYYSKTNLTRILKTYGFDDFIYFHGVDFGLLPKLKKLRGFISHPKQFYKYIKTSVYHFLSKISFKTFSLTSSFVLYAFKK